MAYRVPKGDSLDVRPLNRALSDAARGRQQATGNPTRTTPTGLHPGIVRVVNTTGEDRERWEVLAINDSPLTFGEDPDAEQFPIVNGVKPTESSECGLFVVLQEPLPKDEIGVAVISGKTWVKFAGGSSCETSNESLDLLPGEYGLDYKTGGSAQVITDAGNYKFVRLSNYRTPELREIKFTECLKPGESAAAKFLDAPCGSDDDGLTAHDPRCVNCYLPGERGHVRLNDETCQYELVGSYGLRRRTYAGESVAECSTGQAWLLCKGDDTGESSSAESVSESAAGCGCNGNPICSVNFCVPAKSYVKAGEFPILDYHPCDKVWRFDHVYKCECSSSSSESSNSSSSDDDEPITVTESYTVCGNKSIISYRRPVSLWIERGEIQRDYGSWSASECPLCCDNEESTSESESKKESESASDSSSSLPPSSSSSIPPSSSEPPPSTSESESESDSSSSTSQSDSCAIEDLGDCYRITLCGQTICVPKCHCDSSSSSSSVPPSSSSSSSSPPPPSSSSSIPPSSSSSSVDCESLILKATAWGADTIAGEYTWNGRGFHREGTAGYDGFDLEIRYTSGNWSLYRYQNGNFIAVDLHAEPSPKGSKPWEAIWPSPVTEVESNCGSSSASSISSDSSFSRSEESTSDSNDSQSDESSSGSKTGPIEDCADLPDTMEIYFEAVDPSSPGLSVYTGHTITLTRDTGNPQFWNGSIPCPKWPTNTLHARFICASTTPASFAVRMGDTPGGTQWWQATQAWPDWHLGFPAVHNHTLAGSAHCNDGLGIKHPFNIIIRLG